MVDAGFEYDSLDYESLNVSKFSGFSSVYIVAK